MEENTLADSIAVGVPRNADKALAAIRESRGLAVTVSDEEILDAMRLLGRTQGIFGEPAGVTGTAGIKKALELGLIDPDSTVVSVVTGNGLKDVQSGIRVSSRRRPGSRSMKAMPTGNTPASGASWRMAVMPPTSFPGCCCVPGASSRWIIPNSACGSTKRRRKICCRRLVPPSGRGAARNS